MSTYGNNGTLLGKLITWFFVALLTIAAIKLTFWVLGMAVGLGAFLLFTVGPLLLIGWLVVKVLRWLTRSDGYSSY